MLLPPFFLSTRSTCQERLNNGMRKEARREKIRKSGPRLLQASEKLCKGMRYGENA